MIAGNDSPDTERMAVDTPPVIWPAIAAGVSALLGMGSCALSVVPLTGFLNAPWLAPIIGIVMTGSLFRAFLPLRTSSDNAPGQRVELRRAVAAVWATTVAISLIVASQVNSTFRKPEAELDVYLAGLVVGALIGAVFARLIHVIGQRYFRRMRAREAAGGLPT